MGHKSASNRSGELWFCDWWGSATHDAGRPCGPDRLDAGRGPTRRFLQKRSSTAKAEPAWPPLTLFEATFLAVWYGLSDVKLAKALENRASFDACASPCGHRRFSSREVTPSRTTFVRFRKTLVGRDGRHHTSSLISSRPLRQIFDQEG